MVPDPPPIGSARSEGALPVRPGEGQKSTAGEKPALGAAFKALLEKLETKAHALHEEGQTVENPEELASAVDRAKSSLDDALSLSDQLLEAYRATQQRADGGEEVK